MILLELRYRIFLVVLSICLSILGILLRIDLFLYRLDELINMSLVEKSILAVVDVLGVLIVIVALTAALPVLWAQIYWYVVGGLVKEERRRLERCLLIASISYAFTLYQLEILYRGLREFLYIGIEQGMVEGQYRLILDLLLILILVGQLPLVLEISLSVRLVTGRPLMEYRPYYLLIGALVTLGDIGLLLFVLVVYEFLLVKERIREVKQ